MPLSNIIGLVVLIALLVYLISIYNSLVTLRNRFKNSFSQIDVQLQRRYELIPNLVETAKSYMQHERETLQSVIEARNQAQAAANLAARHPEDGQTVQKLMGAETLLGSTLGRFFALAEAYPDLKANQTMQQLMEELTSTENRVAFARQAFNDAVMQYNTEREQFPNNFIAGPFSFRPAQLLELEDPEAKQPLRIAFN
jgi:LemA protein